MAGPDGFMNPRGLIVSWLHALPKSDDAIQVPGDEDYQNNVTDR
jgi:hypothetical protein